MGFLPVAASENIRNKYMRYLKTIFSIDNEVYNRQFQEQLDEAEILSAGPYLDVSDSFEKGKSIEGLIEEGIIAENFRKINIPTARPLYKHQEIAVRKAMQNQNLIVSTGTGSGKTESFMIPVLNHLVREYENGTLDSGVRALLIYPMNALANDQVERLRELLVKFPEITYGSYTGQTKQKYSTALVEYKQLNEGKEPPINELISREQIKETPPHILITNYAMLEYLMVRPGDNVFFCDEDSQKWKYIVLDEAHVYNGSSGIEVSMLLRRLKAKLQNDGINYILTSATLGDEKTNNEVASFGSNLCNSRFVCDNIVRAYRTKPQIPESIVELPEDFYVKCSDLLENNNENELSAFLSALLKKDEQKFSLEEKLYTVILRDRNYHKVKRIVDKTRTIDYIASAMNWSVDSLSAFVAVASKAERNGERLFDARYHMFLRATESVFITLNPNNKLFLTRKKTHFEPDGTDYHVFEIATCNICHAVYLVGTEKNNHLMQSSFQSEDDLKSVFLLKDSISDTDDEHAMEEEEIEAEGYEICARCGFLRKTDRKNKTYCEHGDDYMVKAFKVKLKSEKGVLTKCLSCENTNNSGILRMFFTGQEAVTSVIGTALFEELPSYKSVTEVEKAEDDFGFGFDEEVSVEHRISEAKQFIAFSDSRQAAAFFSDYFEQTYKNILYKRLVVETLKGVEHRVNTELFAGELAAQFEKYNVVNPYESSSEKEAWKAILHEMADNNGVTSLLSMGLICFELLPDMISENKKLGLSKEEVHTLCNVFAVGMMAEAALHYNCNLNTADKEFFTHNGVEYSYTLSDPDTKALRRSFVPRFTDRKNKRTDYFYRIMEKSGVSIDLQTVNKYLEAIWNHIFVRNGYLKAVGGCFKIDCQKVVISKPQKLYVCPKCKKITPYNIRGVCPSYMCSGELTEIDFKNLLKDNHYYSVYRNLDIRKLRVVEHTAQLNKETAYEYQKKFKRKEIDVLSCSTTFEMGVDVGSLETVFMRNMPPSPANYAQRAGRAGRSKHAAAFALTFCNKSNHDFSFFADPVQMIKGRIDPPRFVVENEKIAIRHIYASALAFFWQRYDHYFSSAAAMAEKNDNLCSGSEMFVSYLKSKPEELKAYLMRFLPKILIEKFDVENFGWIDKLIGLDEQNPGVLTKAIAEYEYEVGILNRAKEEALKNNGYVDRLTERIKVYRNEDILSFFSRKNVMPKYGFPVDTVEMSVVDRNGKSKMGLQLQRDLSVAISEYAPGSQIVANGNLITSRYIKKVPRMSWKMYDYVFCDCNSLNIELHVPDNESTDIDKCRHCGSVLDGAKKKTFLVPEFGFEADGDKITKPGLKKPEKTYRSEVFYVGYHDNLQTQRFDIDDFSVEIAMSRSDEMAVINESNFFVCEKCGYTDLDDKCFSRYKRMKHKTSAGYWCHNDGSNTLKRFSLGYRFETDVLQLRLLRPDLTDWETAVSLLHGIIRGACKHLNIEQDDISGCLQYFYNDVSKRGNFGLILYDKTPGGAGHVRRLANPEIIKNVFDETLRLMKACTCGGEDRDSSCYSCLRSYYNQKHHDILSRGKVIAFLEDFIK